MAITTESVVDYVPSTCSDMYMHESLAKHGNLIAAIRTGLLRVHTAMARAALGKVVDLLEETRKSGDTGSLFPESRASNPVAQSFKRTLATMTVTDRDEATDEFVLALTFAIAGDEDRARSHLVAIPDAVAVPRDRTSLSEWLWHRPNR